MNNSQQKEIVLALAGVLSPRFGADWDIQPAKDITVLAENAERLIGIVPNRISWKRQSRGRVYAIHFIDIVFIDRVGLVDVDEMIIEIDKLAREFLGDEIVELRKWPCMSADTIDEAAAGFDPESLVGSPSMFYGGLRLEFWGE